MSAREVFCLVVGGLISLYGVLVWRIAWTGELPRALRAGGGWRARLRFALAVSPPTGRLMPLVIVLNWTLFLMYLCFLSADRLEGAAQRVFRTAGLGLLAAFVALALLAVAVHLSGRPRWAVPPYARRDRRG